MLTCVAEELEVEVVVVTERRDELRRHVRCLGGGLTPVDLVRLRVRVRLRLRLRVGLRVRVRVRVRLRDRDRVRDRVRFRVIG